MCADKGFPGIEEPPRGAGDVGLPVSVGVEAGHTQFSQTITSYSGVAGPKAFGDVGDEASLAGGGDAEPLGGGGDDELQRVMEHSGAAWEVLLLAGEGGALHDAVAARRQDALELPLLSQQIVEEVHSVGGGDAVDAAPLELLDVRDGLRDVSDVVVERIAHTVGEAEGPVQIRRLDVVGTIKSHSGVEGAKSLGDVGDEAPLAGGGDAEPLGGGGDDELRGVGEADGLVAAKAPGAGGITVLESKNPER